MANTWYVDYVNGNNSNAGTSWGASVADVAKAITLSAAGDTIKVAKSTDPVDTTIQATWTSLSKTVTLSQACNVTIDDCDSGWVAKTNVTLSYPTGKSGNRVAITSTSGFTTGLLAYKATGALDLSQYHQISLWFNASTGIINAGDLVIKLYSDAAATVEIASFSLPAIPVTSRWQTAVVDYGAPLPSNVAAIGLYAQTAYTSKGIYLDNIVACKAPSDPLCITHNTLLSKSNTAQGNIEGWYPIQAISGTTIAIDNDTNTTTSGRGYWSDTSVETVELYTRQPILLPPPNGQNVILYDTNGKIGLDIEGGWNISNSTQDGETWFNCQNGYGIVFNVVNNQTINLFGILRAANPVQCTNTYAGLCTISIPYLTVVGCMYGMYGSGSAGTVVINSTALLVFNCANGISPSGSGSGFNSGTFQTLVANNCTQVGFSGANSGQCGGNSAGLVITCNNSSTGLACGTFFHQGKIGQLISKSNAAYGLSPNYAVTIRIGTLTSANNANGAVLGNTGTVLISKADVSDSAVAVFNTAANTYQQNAQTLISKLNGSNNHWMFTDNGTVNTQATVVHTPNGLAWKMVPVTSSRSVNYPIMMSVAKVAVQAGSPVTASVWMQKSTSAIGGRLVLRGGQISGVTSDVYADCSDGNIGAWEQVSITFTPTDTGVIELECWTWYKTGTGSLYVDDFSCTQ